MKEPDPRNAARCALPFSACAFRYSARALLLASLVVACNSKPSRNPGDIFPADKTVAEWVKSSATRAFDADHLYEYIDGDADKYVRAGLVKALTSEYRWKDKVDATVDVYVMGNASEAQKVYNDEPAAGSQPVALGDAGRYAAGSLTFRQGPFLVRAVAFGDSPEIASALEALARGVSDRLRKSSAPP